MEHIPVGRSKWPGLSCVWWLPLAHKHSMVSFGDLIFMAWATGHPSQSDLVWESWKYDSLSKYHLRVSKSYNNVDSITLENQGGRITWKQNTQTGPKGRPSTTKDNFLWDSAPRAHSSEAALKHPGKTSKEREKIHNAFLKQLCIAGADAAVPGLQLYHSSGLLHVFLPVISFST